MSDNRPDSLHRLLTSLEDSDYDFPINNPHWNLELEIHIDGGGGEKARQAVKVAKEFAWSHGPKVSNVFPFHVAINYSTTYILFFKEANKKAQIFFTC